MNDKVVVITGANSGIGKAATIKFASEDYTVVMACRNIEKARKVQKEIISLTNNNCVHLLKLDLASFDSIKQFCTTMKERYSKLDILINNAAHISHGEKNYLISNDGIELSFATNTVGPFLLTHLLIDLLKKSPDPRILNSCSTNIRHFFDVKRRIEFDNLRGEYIYSRAYNSYKMYGDSKMALLMLTFKMSDVYSPHNIKVNAVQIPAIKISKETIKKVKSLWRIAAYIQNAFSSSRESMADTYFYLCTSKELKNVTGKLINDKREIVHKTNYHQGVIQEVKQFFDKNVYPKYADDINTINKIWNYCIDICE